MLSRRLATLLEGAGCFLFFCEVKYSLYFKFGGKKAVKLENEVNIELSCCCWLSVITKNKGLSVFCLVILPLTWLLVLNPQKKKKICYPGDISYKLYNYYYTKNCLIWIHATSRIECINIFHRLIILRKLQPIIIQFRCPDLEIAKAIFLFQSDLA